MLRIKNLTAKNFMSIGNVSQAITFEHHNLTLVLGENLDLGGDDAGARNGTGKTTIVNALSYALFGSALSKIGKDNLVNKTNNKHMVVTCEFAQNNIKYRIERGRKPNFLKFFINNNEKQYDDEAQGDMRITQRDINHVLKLSHDMFAHIVALNTYTEPFLAMRTKDQRDVIEQLLGITLLSEKASTLKEEIRETKDSLREEELRIKATNQANKKIQETIYNLERKSKIWNNEHANEIKQLTDAIDELEKVNIKTEVRAHKNLKKWKEITLQLKSLNKEYETLTDIENRCSITMSNSEKNYQKSLKNKCPTCGQELNDIKHKKIIDDLENQVRVDTLAYNVSSNNVKIIIKQKDKIKDPGKQPEVYYDNEHDVTEHRTTLKYLKNQCKEKDKEKNPYNEQIIELQNEALQEINYDKVNLLSDFMSHQEFLFKLLTKKDSFIRRKIIDQNLAYLNKRLQSYISNIGLPHHVEFMNDLSVEISEYGRNLDFDNLSRGERNRLILSLSWAFRDVYESLNEPINLLFVDELIDSGMDESGVESCLAILKKMSRDRNKGIFLISHKDELMGRVNNILTVTKENGFTTYSNDVDVVNI